MAQIVISYIAIGAYFVRMKMTSEILDVFDKTYGNGYIRLDKVCYTYIYHLDIENIQV